MVLVVFFHVIFVLLVLKNESSHVIDKYSTNETHQHLSYFAILLLTSEFAKYSWTLDVRRKCQASYHIEERKLHSSTAHAAGHGSGISTHTPRAICV